MNLPFYLWLFLTLGLGFTSQAQGIAFENEVLFDKIKAKAKAQNKFIFVSLSASWCTTCHRMKNQVYTQKQLGDFFNQHFVSWQLDGERDALAKDWVAEYELRVYPSFLFFDAQGVLKHYAQGFQTVEQLLAIGQDALEDSTQWLPNYQRYKEGEQDPVLLRRLAYLAHRYRHEQAETLLQAYLKTQSDWLKPEVQTAIFDLNTDTESLAFQFMVRHQDRFALRFGEEALQERLLAPALLELNAFMMQQEEEFSIERDLPPIFERFLSGPRAERLIMEQQLELYANDGQWDKFFPLASRFERKYLWFRRRGGDYEPRAKAYLHLASLVSSNSDRRKHLKQASRWCHRSVKLNPSYANCYTLASYYYYGLADKRRAKKYLRKAIKRSASAPERERKMLKDLEQQIKQR